MILNSIRSRLVVWLAFLLLCVLVGFGFTVFGLQRQNRLNQVDTELEHRLASISTDARAVPTGPQPAPLTEEAEDNPTDPSERNIVFKPRTARLFNEADTNDFYFAFWSREADVLKLSTNAPTDLGRPRRPGNNTLVHFRMRDPLREAYHFNEMGECALVGVSLAGEKNALQQFGAWLVLIGGGVLVVGLGGVWWLVNRAIRPVETISGTARRIAAGNLSERIKVREYTSELGQLAGVLNSTFARLEAAFVQQKHFAADASHELRTPISVLISEAQTTLARERSSDEYRETVEACLETAQQMRELMESLLELAHFDANQDKMSRVSFNLAEKVRACIDLLHPQAEQKGLQIQSHLPDTEVMGDPDRISQVVINLITNAIRYNKDFGTIGVTIHPSDDAVDLTISDTGWGITPEDLPHVFERFYRADKARAGGTGGAGLGLAICKTIVEAHDGRILVSSKMDIGTLFMVQLPLAAPSTGHHEAFKETIRIGPQYG